MNPWGAGPSGPPTLRGAAGAVHRDSRWWAKCLGYGAAALTGIGLPLAAGFVMESLDNSRRGYPTPLPPWSDPSLRWLTGLFCLLIDFAFFMLPLLMLTLILVCGTIALLLPSGADGAPAPLILALFLTCIGLLATAIFTVGAAPAGRLIFAREGKLEDAISGETLRWATAPPRRGLFLRARLASLPAYLPALLLAAATGGLTLRQFPGQTLVVGIGAWLTLAALVYAHLVVVQLYVAAEREAERRTMGRSR